LVSQIDSRKSVGKEGLVLHSALYTRFHAPVEEAEPASGLADLVDNFAEEVDDDAVGEDLAINAIDYLTSRLDRLSCVSPKRRIRMVLCD
jgi:hypothetical protein